MFVYLVVLDSIDGFIDSIFSKKHLAKSYAKEKNTKRIKQRKSDSLKYKFKYIKPEQFIVEKWEVDKNHKKD